MLTDYNIYGSRSIDMCVLNVRSANSGSDNQEMMLKGEEGMDPECSIALV